MRTRYLGTAMAGIILACASAGTAGGPSHSTNVLTREEIASASVTNAYDAVQRLRPQFLRQHGATTFSASESGYPTVYLNRHRYGDISMLKQIEISAILEIHYYTPTEAANRFAVSSPSGAIEVITDVH
jgi:hypothetical protein